MSALRQVEELLYREARCLDLAQYAEWLALYTQDCEYWVPATPGQTDAKRQVSLYYEDRVLMETRIRRLEHPAAHSLTPMPRTSRIIGNVMLEDDNAAAPVVRSSFHLLEYRGEDHRLLGGHYIHHLRREGGVLKIRAKRVDLVNCDGVFEILQLFL